jgi:catechol 2,3-dioxygenase-like lactoylglutathione lyase family enzyme
MKRFHVHISVNNLADSIDFYSALFGLEPHVTKPDYAKWMLDDPRINFAISERGAKAGLDHLGIQVESDDELEALNRQFTRAALPVAEQKAAACCYSESNKYWTIDPQGIAWETFHSLASIPLFGNDTPVPVINPESACCPPSSGSNCQ